MEEKRRKLWSLVAVVASGLVLLALAALGASAWATDGLLAQDQTVPAPPWKSCEKKVVLPGGDARFDICIEVPEESLPWDHIVVTDVVDSYLAIRGVSASQGEVFRVGQLVTADLGTIATGVSATVQIDVRVRDYAPPGGGCPNTAIVYARNFLEPEASETITLTIGIPLYLPLVMKGYSAP